MSSKTDATKSPKAKRASTPDNKERSEKPATEEKKPDAAKKGGFLTPKTAIIIVVVSLICYALKKTVFEQVDLKQLMMDAVSFVESQGTTAVYWYCLITFTGVVCLVPTTPMELAGGFIFSPKYGMWTVLAFTGASKICANVVSVLIARYLVKDWVMNTIVEKTEVLRMVRVAVKEEPWKMAFLVRGSMVPLAVKNYGLGVMDIDMLPIMACSMIFTNFYAFQNIYMGSTLQNLQDVFAPKKASDAPQGWDTYLKKTAPIAFNVILIIFLVKAVKDQVRKQKAKIEEDLKKKQEKAE